MPTIGAVTNAPQSASPYQTTTANMLMPTSSVMHNRNSVALQQRLQPEVGYNGHTSDIVVDQTTQQRPTPTIGPASTLSTSASGLASIILSHFLPTTTSTSSPYSMVETTTTMPSTATTTPSTTSTKTTTTGVGAGAAAAAAAGTSTTIPTATTAMPAFSIQGPPSIGNLVASSAEDLSNFRDVTFDIFDEDDDLFGSPLAFDASENGLWNGRFVPPPPRPPFLVDEAVLSDGLTTCDLCSWAMPTKSTFIFEGTIEKASELGWPLTLIIVSILSALFGAIIMVTVVRCRRKKASNNRNAETHVQWWSRNKRPASSNNNHLRRSNIYTAHPADNIRGLQQPSLSAASSFTAITAMGGGGTSSSNIATPGMSSQQQQQLQSQQELHEPHQYQTHNRIHQHHHQHTLRSHTGMRHNNHHHHLHHHHMHHYRHHHPHQQQQQQHQQHQQHQLFPQHDYDDYEHEYHQPQELQLHQRQLSSSLSSSSTSSPSLTNLTNSTMMPHKQVQHQPQQHNQQYFRDDTADAAGAGIVAATAATSCHWPNTTMLLAS